MERKNVAVSLPGFVFSFQQHFSLLFFCCIIFWSFGRRNPVVAHLDPLLRETQTIFDTSKFLKQSKTSETGIILGGIRTRDIWVRSPARYSLRYEDLWSQWVYFGKNEWYWNERTVHLLFLSSWLIQTDRIKTPYHFLSLRSLARRLCRAVVNPVVLLAFELQISFPDLLRLMFLLLFQKVLVFFYFGVLVVRNK